jgi:hypothetical protein
VEGKIKIEKEGKAKTLDFGWIDKKEFELLKKRYLTLGFKVEEIK